MARVIIAAGAVLWIASAATGWFDGDLRTIRPDHLTPVTGWAYLLALPMLLTPFVPAGRWTLWWLLACLPPLGAALLAYAAADSGVTFPYLATDLDPRWGLPASLAAVTLCAFGIVLLWLQRDADRGSARPLAIAAAVAVALISTATLRADLAGERLEGELERVLHEAAPQATVKVRCDGNGPDAQCTYLIDEGDGGSQAATFSGGSDAVEAIKRSRPPE